MSTPTRLTPDHELWPRGLSEIDGAPGELWAVGRLELLSHDARIGIVGTRGPTRYGREQAALFGAALAREGWTIVSGLARGIDEVSHRAALDAGGGTIAVLGCGVDRPWPEGPLAERMASEGLLVSEFPPGTPPRKHHFPLRNRILSALSLGVLVVEAARISGSLITARWASDQGRGVFVLPGPVDSPLSAGTLHLIREGASPVGSPGELLGELTGCPGAPELSGARDPSGPPGPRSPLAAALSGGQATPEELARELGRPLAEVLVELVQAELDGLAARGPGGLYRLVGGR